MLTILCLLAALSTVDAYYEKVLMKDVRYITFYKNQYTVNRRSRPVEQISCSSYYFRDKIDSVVCENVGTSWKCDTDLQRRGEIIFDNITLQCEGFDSDDDTYVLANSCHVSFDLLNGPVLESYIEIDKMVSKFMLIILSFSSLFLTFLLIYFKKSGKEWPKSD